MHLNNCVSPRAAGALLGADGAGELHESAQLSRHLPSAGGETEGSWRTGRAAEVPDGPGARCVSTC